LILKKLEINGFKSFADKIDLSFGSGITGIVGPNGSGKSNVADAVRWALGEQSAKQLRGATMTDIIFNGTEKRRQQQYCEVSLTFDNSDRTVISEYDEIMVTRRVYRNGDSDYFLNKTSCRLKDIVSLFHDTGIGKDGYSLVGQGRIDEILSLKSEDRRSIFEEAAGIVKYKTRKTEAERRLEHAMRNLTRIEDIMGELENSLDPLKSQAETARKYLQLSQTLRELDLASFAHQYNNFNEKADVLKKEIEQLSEENDRDEALEREYSAALEELEEAAAKFDGAISVCHEDVIALTREHEAAFGETQLLSQRRESLKADKERIEKEAGDAKARLAALEMPEDGDFSRQQALELELEKSRERLGSLEERIEEAQRSLDKDEELLEEKKREMISSLNRLSDVKAAVSRMTAMRESVLSRIEAVKQQKAELKPKTHVFFEAAEQARLTGEAALGEFERLSALLKQLNGRQQALRDELTQAFSAQDRLTAKEAEIQSRLKLLRQMQQDYEGYNQSVKEVLRFADSSGDSSIHGVVAGIIKTPREIERAVEMALGAQAQNIVCDSEQDAKRMIEFLRKNRYGRATFLPISAVKGRSLNAHERNLLQMPGCIGVASQLIGYEKKYAEIIESLLGRTVVASDLDSGIAIMKAAGHSFRLVTLAGDVMNPGGSMTGGSLHTRMVSILSRKREIGEGEEELKQINLQGEQSAARIKEVQQQREAMRVDIAELSELVHQQEIACARDAERHENAVTRLAEHEGNIARLESELSQLEQSRADIDEKLSKMQGEENGGHSDNTGVQAEVEALSALVGEKRARLESLREERSGLRVQMSAVENDIRLALRDEQHLQAEKKRISEALGTLKAQLASALIAMPAVKEELAAAASRLEKAKAKLDESTARQEMLEHERLKKQQEQRSLSDNMTRLRVAARQVTEKKHSAELRLSRMESDLQARTERIWEDYSLTYAGALPFLAEGFDFAQAQKDIENIRRDIRAMGSVNVGAIDEYRQASERYDQLSTQKADILTAMDDLSGIIKDLEGKMQKQFVQQFELMNKNFSTTFSRLFGGGHAELKLSDSSEPLTCGIDIVAQPPGKKLQLLSLLSGGERALTAIAIIFAIMMLKPAPFCILDEIDAALDEANVINFANFLSDFSKDTQFIVVTHRKGTMESCNGLYGISMEEKGISKIVSVSLAEG
jgi:chromosome segregation protein